MNAKQDYCDYGFRSDWDGDGDIYNVEKQTVIWKFQSKRLQRRMNEAKPSRTPVFVVSDSKGGELLAIYREKRLPLARFKMTEKNSPIGSISQHSIFFTKYKFEFKSGSKWNIYLPMFSVVGRGESENNDRLVLRVHSRRQWFIRLSAGLDSPPLMAALAFVIRKKLQCT